MTSEEALERSKAMAKEMGEFWRSDTEQQFQETAFLMMRCGVSPALTQTMLENLRDAMQREYGE